jgi:hypothetical protein
VTAVAGRPRADGERRTDEPGGSEGVARVHERR